MSTITDVPGPLFLKSEGRPDVKHGWFIRGKRSKLFVGVQGSVLRAFALPADATMFPSAVAAQAVADSVVMAPELEVVDMVVHEALPPDADQTPVRSRAQVIKDALDEDAPREAQRRATWGLIEKAAVVLFAAGALFASSLFQPAAARPQHNPQPPVNWSFGGYDYTGTYHPGDAHTRHSRVHVSRGARAHYGALRVRGHAPAGLVANEPFSLSGAASSAVAVASRYLGGNPTGHSSLWCADFANFVERQLGRAGTGSREALSFLHYGTRVHDPAPGDVVVLGRRGGGHVGFLVKMTAAGPEVISGNHGHRVGIGVYSASRVLAYVRPS